MDAADAVAYTLLGRAIGAQLIHRPLGGRIVVLLSFNATTAKLADVAAGSLWVIVLTSPAMAAWAFHAVLRTYGMHITSVPVVVFVFGALGVLGVLGILMSLIAPLPRTLRVLIVLANASFPVWFVGILS